MQIWPPLRQTRPLARMIAPTNPTSKKLGVGRTHTVRPTAFGNRACDPACAPTPLSNGGTPTINATTHEQARNPEDPHTYRVAVQPQKRACRVHTSGGGMGHDRNPDLTNGPRSTSRQG